MLPLSSAHDRGSIKARGSRGQNHLIILYLSGHCRIGLAVNVPCGRLFAALIFHGPAFLGGTQALGPLWNGCLKLLPGFFACREEVVSFSL